MKTINIDGRKIGEGQPCFIVAEMSANHGQDFDQAIKIVKAAKEAGADAIKVQTFTADVHTINSNKKWFRVGGPDNPSSWQDETFYDLYKKASMPWEWHLPLKQAAHEKGLIFFSSPVDATGVDYLESVGVPCYKIASYEMTDIEFLKHVAKTGKPVILSVGFASREEIEESVKALRDAGTRDIVLLHCTTSYQEKENAPRTNLQTMLDLAKRFDVISGFSDNMGGVDAPVLAAAMGAAVIEKHFIAEHDPKIFDDRFSIDKNMFAEMVRRIRANESMRGEVSYGCQTESETYNKNFRRSLFVVKDVKKGEVLSNENIRSIRPGYGLAPKFINDVLGKIAVSDIERGTPLNWELISK